MSWRRRSISRPTSALGHLVLDQLRDRVDHLLAQRQLRLHLLHHRHARADVGAQLVDGVELGRLARPLVGDVGEELLLHLLDEDLDGDVVTLVAAGDRRVELEDVAGLGAAQLLVELGHHRAAADLVEVVVGGEALDASRSGGSP